MTGINHAIIGGRVVDAVGEAGARELPDVFTRPEADGAALIGRLSLRDDGKWLDFCNSSWPDRSRGTEG